MDDAELRGFTPDGYIKDQDMFAAYPYREMSSDINGCGWIAAYDLRRALGQEADFNAVRAEMDAMFTLRVPGPTTMDVMCRYLRKYVPEHRLTRKRAQAAEATARSRAGILRYWEGYEPHFVAYVRVDASRCRFFNVADGLEDYTCPMDEFLRTHCVRGCLMAITVE